ncbi:MAG: hypothetical protein IT492_03210 [Gammaproteobacteria bacterium]|nr:hypothetical protein [Gammaproteobacteria bacterium]
MASNRNIRGDSQAEKSDDRAGKNSSQSLREYERISAPNFGPPKIRFDLRLLNNPINKLRV